MKNSTNINEVKTLLHCQKKVGVGSYYRFNTRVFEVMIRMNPLNENVILVLKNMPRLFRAVSGFSGSATLLMYEYKKYYVTELQFRSGVTRIRILPNVYLIKFCFYFRSFDKESI